MDNSTRGFTLIELSIVLVIIGLIVGGVLVGQDLIKAAQVRAEVTQLERYNTAVNTFNSKYGGLPGDLLNGNNYFTLFLGGTGFQNSATAGLGNGDGLIESIDTSSHTCNATNSNGNYYNCIGGENVIFWYELNQAALISDNTSYCGSYHTSGNCAAGVTSAMIPNGKIPGSTVSINAYSDGHNYWVLANQSGSLAFGNGVPGTNGPGLTVLQAYQVDTKIDDGMPGTGTVISISGGEPGLVGDAAAVAAYGSGGAPGSTPLTNNCGNEANTAAITPGTTAYNIAAAGNNVNCQISVRTNF